MTNLVFALLLLALAIAGVVVRKTYYALPLPELKRRAEKGNKQAAVLYPAVAYGSSLQALLWLFIFLCSAGGFVLLIRSVSVWLGLLAVIILLWAVFSWLPSSRRTSYGKRLALFVTPSIVCILNYLHPTLNKGARTVKKRYSDQTHTGIYEREDFLKFIALQQEQADSRIKPEELEIIRRALTFDEHSVESAMIPAKQIPSVKADDTIGPVLIDELHKSGQDFVLVRETKKGPIVGTLAFRQLDIKSKGQVHDVMDPTIYYLHEHDNLSEALHAFFVTNCTMFVVVNKFEEYVGIITTEEILKQLIGHFPGDDFDQYADLQAVAARHNPHKKLEKPEETEQIEEIVVE